jgi:iron complex outermembrane receptor protein
MCGASIGTARAASDPGPVLRGRVVDTAGAPVAWASVEVRYGNEERGPAGLTREDGGFELRIRAEGALRVRRLGYHAWSGTFSLADTARDLSIQLDPAPRPIVGVEIAALRRPGLSGDLAVPIERLTASELRARTPSFPVLSGFLRETPEVTTIGRDQYNGAPAVRGLARFRTVMFLDGARINSDREIGATASFVDPASLQSVEIIRGPGSVLYGSDAIGGVVLLRSDDAAEGAWARAGWSSVNRGFQSATGVGLPAGRGKISLSASHTQAGDYALPGKPYPWASDARLARNSGFERSTGRARYASDRLEASALYSLGENIGRPSLEEELFTVPSEEHVLASLRWRRPDAERPLEVGGYVHPVTWEAHVLEPQGAGVREQLRTYRSVDWGALFTAASTRENGSWVVGLQTDARSDVRIHRRLVDRDASGAITNEQFDRWVDGVSVGQAGAFAHGLVKSGVARWNAGARVDAAWRAGSARDVQRLIPTGQAGVSLDVGKQAVLSANIASAFREPTVTELFFAGRRPAGYLEGNPDLQPERSYQADLGARWIYRGLFVGASGFGIIVGDYIGLRTRAAGVGGDPDTLVYDNTPRGVLFGCALQVGTAVPWRGVSGRAFIDVVRGSDQDGAPLADAHPVRGALEVRWNRGSTEAGLRWRASIAHHRVGPNERPAPGYGVLDLHAGAPVGPVSVALSLENVLDQEYYERADPVAYSGPGRALGLTFRWAAGPLTPRP